LKQYLVVIEKARRNYSAYLPDVPGCVATGKTVKEVKENIAEALKFHLNGLAEDGIMIPDPSAKSDYITA
jgi:predicted RNase H-like HicB family nuclease